MGTTTASKHGLRAAATERRSRHAQRTPLPPRTGVIEEARLPVCGTAVLEAAGTKSGAKAQAFAESVRALGWDATITAEGSLSEVIATRGTETIHQAWMDGVYQPLSATYTIADRTVQTRNVAAARRYAERVPDAADAELAKVAANKQFRRRETEPQRFKLPFDPTAASEREIIDALVGRSVKWHNRFRQVEESAIVSTDPRRIRVEEQHGSRVVLFCCPATGFRAFRIEALTRVGRAGSRAGVDAALDIRKARRRSEATEDE